MGVILMMVVVEKGVEVRFLALNKHWESPHIALTSLYTTSRLGSLHRVKGGDSWGKKYIGV